MSHPPTNRPPAAVDDDAARNPQAMKVRRLEQSLFLREMERLADAMCRHYAEARTDTASVPADDIRTHIDTIHDRVHNTIEHDLVPDLQLLRGLQSATALPLDEGDGLSEFDDPDAPPRAAAAAGGTTAESHAATARARRVAEHPHDPRAGAAPTKPKSQWTAQEGRGVALRLRGMASVSVQTQRQFRARAVPTKPTIVPSEEPLLSVSRFNTDSAGELALLDMNMDNNTVCLSARRHGSKNPVDIAQKRATVAKQVKPRPPPLRFPTERLPPGPAESLPGTEHEQRQHAQHQQQQQQAAAASSSSTVGAPSPGGSARLARSSTKAASWSPRDTLALTAKRKKGGATTTSPVPGGAHGGAATARVSSTAGTGLLPSLPSFKRGTRPPSR